MKFEFPKLYTSLAKYYDDLESQYRDHDLEARWLSKLFAQYKVKLALDISCGTGNHVSRLAPTHEFVATDASREMLEVAFKKIGEKASLVRSDFLTTPFKASSFDAVICMYWSIAGLDANLTTRLFSNVALLLKSRGVFVFDAENTRGIKEDLLGAPFIDATFPVDDGAITRVNHSEKISDDVVDWKSYYIHETLKGAEMISDRMKLRFFSRDQIAAMLSDSGFELEQVLSSGLKEYYRESPTLYFVARKK